MYKPTNTAIRSYKLVIRCCAREIDKISRFSEKWAIKLTSDTGYET